MAAKQKAGPPKGGVATVKWREHDVFACTAQGCVYVHERKDRVEQHVKRGDHLVPKGVRVSVGTDSDAEPDVTKDSKDSKEVTDGQV